MVLLAEDCASGNERVLFGLGTADDAGQSSDLSSVV